MIKLIYYIKRFFTYIGYLLFRPIWWFELLIPKNKSVWIFGSWYGKKYSDNPKWVFEWLNSVEGKKIFMKNGKRIIPVWITKNKNIYNELTNRGLKVRMSKSISGIWTELRAAYCFLGSGNTDINPLFTNRCKQIWLWHGMPLKKIGYADHIFNKCSSKFHIAFAKVLNPYTIPKYYSTPTTSNFFSPYLVESFQLTPEQIWDTGLPRNDCFFGTLSKYKEEIIQTIRLKYRDCKIIFFMPTFRMTAIDTNASINTGIPKHAYNPFDSKYGFNSIELELFLERNNLVLLYKPHFVDTGIKIDEKGDRFLYIDDSMFNDLYVLLNSVDAVITDYSSVYFDFIVSGKPMFLFPFDYDDYVIHSRAHFFDMRREMEAPICNNWQDFYKVAALYDEKGHRIINYDGSKKEWKRPSKEEMKKFSEYCDGNSSRKVVEKVIEDAGF